MEIHDITKSLGQAYDKAKEWTSVKEHLRRTFFNAVDEELEKYPVDRRIARVEAANEEEALRIAQRRYQRDVVIDLEEVEDGQWDLILQEDPALKDYSYINPEDGKVYKRIIAEGTPILDDQGIQDENPKLWESITEVQTVRALKPLEDLTPEQQAAIEPYVTMGKPIPKFLTRKAKQEELDEDNNLS